jgi:hypothetical protein
MQSAKEPDYRTAVAQSILNARSDIGDAQEAIGDNTDAINMIWTWTENMNFNLGACYDSDKGDHYVFSVGPDRFLYRNVYSNAQNKWIGWAQISDTGDWTSGPTAYYQSSEIHVYIASAANSIKYGVLSTASYSTTIPSWTSLGGTDGP